MRLVNLENDQVRGKDCSMIPQILNRKYEIGTKIFSFTDDSRNEVLGEGTGKRKITVRLFYPVTMSSIEGAKKAPYVSENKWECLRKMYHMPKSAGVVNEVDIYENVPMIEEKFPLVLYNHGYSGYIEANTFLCMEIVSRGYIVASIGHSYEGLCTEYDDGSFVPFDKKINKMMYQKGAFRAILAQLKLLKKKGSIEEIYKDFLMFEKEHTPYIVGRLKEWSADTLCALKIVKERFADNIDLTNGVAATGHSMGGALAYYLCQTSNEISCGLNIDGGLFGDYREMTLTKPFFQISCKENWNVESAVLLHRKALVYCAIFDNMKHIGFTDAKFFIPVKMIVGKMDAMKMHNYLTKCHIFFLDKYLKGLDVKKIESDDNEIKIDISETE